MKILSKVLAELWKFIFITFPIVLVAGNHFVYFRCLLVDKEWVHLEAKRQAWHTDCPNFVKFIHFLGRSYLQLGLDKLLELDMQVEYSLLKVTPDWPLFAFVSLIQQIFHEEP